MRITLPTDVEFQIPMRPKYVALVRRSIKSLAAEEGYSERDCMDIEIAVGEAVTNALLYGCPDQGRGRVRVFCRLTPGCLIVEVEDEGRATCLPHPQPAPDYDEEHGRGWLIIHRLMDRVAVRCTENGMLVRMVKNRNRAGAGSKGALRGLSTVA